MIETIVNEALDTQLLYEPMPNGAKGSVIICAGGAYVWLSDREEWPVARCYAMAGYQTYILKYSTSEKGPLGTLPLRQLAWAVKTVRARALDEKSFVAVCGFSAGGHLCASLGVHWQDAEVLPEANQALIRPDAMILCYAATGVQNFKRIDATEFRSRLYGGDEALGKYLDCVEHVSEKTPPAFLWHTAADDMVPVQMSLDFAQALLRSGVFTEFHLFPDGLHGLSIATPDVDDPPKGRYADAHTASWVPLSCQWLEKVAARRKE